MKQILLSVLWTALQLPFSTLRSQYFYNTWYYNYDWVWEAGTGYGGMNCLTDLGGRKGRGARFLKDIDWRSSRPCFALYLAATYKDVFTVRVEWLAGSIRAGDSVLKRSDADLSGRYGRNLSFRSKISEFQLAIETHPLFWKIDEQSNIPALSPYLIAGISRYTFNPQAWLGDHWYDLQPLRLEGQGFDIYKDRPRYKLHQWAIPAGIGLRYELGPLINLRFELVYRMLFTDYLDDVSTTYIDPFYFQHYLDPEQASLARQLYNRMDELQPGHIPPPGTQRGNAKNKDAYFTGVLKLGYVFRKKVK